MQAIVVMEMGLKVEETLILYSSSLQQLAHHFPTDDELNFLQTINSLPQLLPIGSYQ
jgi:hypothetical protein